METMGQTRKRNSGEEDAHNRQKCSRRSNSEIMEFLRQKIELDKENLEADREEKRNQNAILMNLINQQQQMMAQQTAIFRELLNNKNNSIKYLYLCFLLRDVKVKVKKIHIFCLAEIVSYLSRV